MSKSEKIGIGIALSAILVIVGFVGFLTTNDEIELKGGGIRLPPTYLNQITSTSSVLTYLQPSATTTFPISSQGADLIDLNIELTSTGTVPVLDIIVEFANNSECITSAFQNCNWHLEQGQTVESTTLVTYGGAPLIRRITPIATSTVGEIWKFNIQIPATAAQNTRFSFSVGTTGSQPPALWAEAIPRIRTAR